MTQEQTIQPNEQEQIVNQDEQNIAGAAVQNQPAPAADVLEPDAESAAAETETAAAEESGQEQQQPEQDGAQQPQPDLQPASQPDFIAPTRRFDSGMGSAEEKDGHKFVQLVRIAEQLEADGFNPVKVRRIDEVLRPLTMHYPERSNQQDEEREHLGKRSDSEEVFAPRNEPPLVLASLPALNHKDAQSPEGVKLELDKLFQDPEGEPLTYSISNLPPGLSFNPKTGEITGTIDKSASQGGSNGIYKVTVTATDPKGASSEQTFTWTVTNPDPEAKNDDGETFKTQRLIKDAESGLLANDSDPDGDKIFVQDVTGKDGKVSVNSNGDTEVKGEYGTLVVKPDGSYTYTPDLSDKTGDIWTLGENDDPLIDTFTYTVSDGEGGTDTAELNIEIKGHSNTPPFLTVEDKNGADVDGQVTVHEKGLAGGSEPGAGHTASGVINVHAMDGLQEISIGTVTITLAQLKALGSGNTITINVDGGEITLTGFDPFDVEFVGGATQTLGGEIYYTYTLGAPQTHNDADGNNSLLLDVQLGVVDDQGRSSIAADNKLTINVIDDVPVAKDDSNAISEDETAKATGNVMTGAASDDQTDTQGADGATVTDVASTSGNPVDDSDPNGILVIEGEYGTLTIEPDGSYTYALHNDNAEVNALKDNETLTEAFTYTLTDTDGDSDTATLTITINGNTDGSPSITPDDDNGNGAVDGHITVHESGLRDPADADDSNIASGSIQISAGDGLASISIAGQSVDLDALLDLGGTPVVIPVEGGTLVLTGFTPGTSVGGVPTSGTLEYTYTLTGERTHGSAGNDDVLLNIPLSVTDAGNETANGTLTIQVVDDVPTAVADSGNVTEGDTLTVDAANGVLENDTAGADGWAGTGAVVGVAAGDTNTTSSGGVGGRIDGQYGYLILNADGSYEYVSTADAVTGDEVDVFTYTVRDGDGDLAHTTLTINVTDVTLAPETTVDSVNESGLSGGTTEGDNSHTTSGQVNLPPGLEVVPGSGTTTHGTFTIDQVGNYSYTLTGNTSGDNTSDSFTYVTTDANGNTVTNTVTIDIVDDEPVAADDVNSIPAGSYAEVTGELVNGGLGGAGKDTEGADGATVTGVVNTAAGTSVTVPTDGTSTTITGQYGVLTIEADGSYRYQRNPGTPGGVQDVFTYTLTDSDGDDDTATLTIDIGNATPTISELNPSLNGGELTFEEKHLTDGSAPDSNQLTKAGDFTISSPDGVGSLAVGGVTVIENGALTSTTTVTTPQGHTLEITGYDPVTGSVTYEYTLTDREDHDQSTSDIELFDDIDVVLTDRDGDSVNDTLSVRIIDDVPQISADALQLGKLEVDETDMVSGIVTATDTDFVKGVFAVNYGADGAATTDALIYTLNIASPGMLSGVIDTASGQAVYLYKEGGDIVGRVGSGGAADAGGDVAFRIELNGTDITLTQSRPLQHPVQGPGVNDHNDPVSLTDGALTLTATATDGDGDTDSASVDIGGRFSFKDDGPRITANPDGGTVDEARLERGSGVTDSSLTVVSNSLNVNFGADGAGNVQFTEATKTTLEAMGLEANNVDLEYVIEADGHTLTAYRGAGRSDDDRIFTVEITNPTGNPGYKFTLQGALDHVGKNENDEQVQVDELVINFKAIKITDGDGDWVETGFEITVTDDDPSTEAKKVNVDEDATVTFNTNADATGSNTKVNSGMDGEGNWVPGEPDDEGFVKTEFGKAKVNDDGTITYVPNENYSGPDKFTYTTTTDNETKTFTVEITVNPVADAPELADDKTISVKEDGIGEDPNNLDDPTGKVSLGLVLPVITDSAADAEVTHPGDEFDYPERLGEITLSLGASGSSEFPTGTELGIDGNHLKPNAEGGYTIIIVDDNGAIDTELHHSDLRTGQTDVNYLTQAEYESIEALLAEDRHENFEVKVSVKSYEVDSAGKPLPDSEVGTGNGGVNGAESTQTITVDVQAVTDAPELTLTAPAQPEDAGATALTVTPTNGTDNGKISATIAEDTTLNLQAVLGEGFQDTDGSESYWYSITGLPEDTVVTIGSNSYTAGSNGTVTMPSGHYRSTSDGADPAFTIRPPLDYSNDAPITATITLHTRDADSDSSVTPATESVSVDLELRVTPVAGDVAAGDVSTTEDTPVDFLQHVRVTDTGTGSEVIDSVAFEIPAGWTVTEPTSTGGWTVSGSGASGDPYTILFDSTLDQGEREAVLDGFLIKPPAHSSKDEDIVVRVTSTDTNGVGANEASDTVSRNLTIKVEVTPVAERIKGGTETDDIDTDGNKNPDLTMTSGRDYTTPGEEDEFFKLGTEVDVDDNVDFRLSAGWSNEDGKWVWTDDGDGAWDEDTSGGRSEDTWALLTPYTTVNNDARAKADTGEVLEGSVFTYFDGTNTITLPFAGEAVRIPMQYLDSVEFKGPANWSGVVKIKVEAGTIDYDEDTGAATEMAVSGESWLTNLIIEPRADQVTLKVDAIIKTDEDVPVTLNINPTSSDPNETFDITISGIPLGAKIAYDGVTYDTQADSLPAYNPTLEQVTGIYSSVDGYVLIIQNFDKTKQPVLTPPLDSNQPISLKVTAQSVDTLEYIDKDGGSQKIVHKDDTKSHTLPINIEVQGVPDEPRVELDQNKVYVEDGDDDQDSTEPLKVPLNELVTSIESGEIGVEGTEEARQPDDSETVTLRISDLPEGFSLVGAGPTLGGTGTDRVWVVSADNLDDVKIILPPHYSGTVKFTVQPVVTENDNPSKMYFDKQNVSFKVTPVPEATLSITSELTEDEVGTLNLTPVLAGDDDEYISAVRIAVADVPAGISFYSDAEGTQPVNASGGYYTFTAPLQVYVKGPANYSGNDVKLKLEYQVTDPSQDPQEMSNRVEGVTSGWKEIWHTLQIKPVTDAIEMELEEATGANVTTTEGVTTLTGPGSVTLQLNIDQKNDTDGRDIDGSEQLTHILIDGVPAGVIVQGAINTAEGQWLLPVGNAFFKEETGNPTGQLSQSLTFVVGGYAANFTEEDIRITAYSRDTGAQEHETATLDWKFTFTQEGDPADNNLPLVTVTDNAYTGTEDTPFSLADAVGGTIESGHTGEYSITVSVRTALDDETDFAGMTLTEVEENGQTIKLWTATVEVGASDTGQDKLDELLQSIQVKTAEHANSNNLSDDGLKLDVNIAVHAEGISRDARIEELAVPITPVTDTFTVGVSANSVGEGEDIPLVITLPGNTDDGELNGAENDHWKIENDVVYVHIADGGLVGQLTDASGQPLTQFTGDRPTGTPAGGSLYAVAPSDLNGLKFVPDAENHAHQTGTLAVTVLVESKENGADNTVISTGAGSLTIHHSNSGYTAEITATGDEFQGQSTDQLIQLNLANEQLVDGAEAISSAFISGLPSGFTVWLNETTMANNAGEGTWAIPVTAGAKTLPQVYIKPPKNWSGTLDNLQLTVMSGHAGLEPSASEIGFSLVVAPKADGIELNPTLSFGDAAAKIALNLNASMKDPVAATGADDDQHTERTTLELSGFPDGQKVMFYIGDTLLTSPQANYEGGKWTLTGLSQAELDQLSFVHGETNGDQTVTVKAWTYEVDADGVQVGAASEPVNGTVEINVTPTVASSGDDLFLWEGKEINGFGGEDTVQLRFGDNLSTTDFSKMENIEVIDMSGEASGANNITSLKIEDVFTMTDSDNTLKIIGDDNDSVTLEGDWDASVGSEFTTYTGTHNGATVTLEVQNILID